jgi:PleD family two-component response regulator
MNSILIIDSKKQAIIELKEFLKKEGYKVFFSNQAHSGLQKAKDKVPDLIFTDLKFSDMDGFDLIRSLKSIDILSYSFLVVYSENSDDFGKILALELGADDYILKSACFREISAKIKSYFKYKRRNVV